MSVNMGTIDRCVRIAVGLALGALAFQDGNVDSGMAPGRLDRAGFAANFLGRGPLYQALGMTDLRIPAVARGLGRVGVTAIVQ